MRNLSGLAVWLIFAIALAVAVIAQSAAAWSAWLWPSETDSPTVVIDGWWSGDYAENGCEQANSWMRMNRAEVSKFGCAAVAGCSELMPRYLACTTGLAPKAQARNYEDNLMTQFAINPNCKGVKFSKFSSGTDRARGLSGSHWTLMIDYVVGSKRQHWTLQDSKRSNQASPLLQGTGATPEKVAEDVCAIVLGQGGAVVQ